MGGGTTAPQWARTSSFTRFLDHTQRRTTGGRTPLDEWSARRRDFYLTTYNTHNRQTSMPPVGFEPTVSAGERQQTYALDCAATGTSKNNVFNITIRVPKINAVFSGFIPNRTQCFKRWIFSSENRNRFGCRISLYCLEYCKMGEVKMHGTSMGKVSLSERFKMNTIVRYSWTARLLTCERWTPFPKVQGTMKPCCITCGRTEPGNSGPSGSFGGLSLMEVIICPWTLAVVLIMSSTSYVLHAFR